MSAVAQLAGNCSDTKPGQFNIVLELKIKAINRAALLFCSNLRG